MCESLKCPYCDRKPNRISEYVEGAERANMTPAEYVKLEEGTYDYRTKLFCCTDCYIKIGMPLNPNLHEAFRYYRRDHEPIDGLDESYINQY